MRRLVTLIFAVGLMASGASWGYDIGLVPVHEYEDRPGQNYGHNISLHASKKQVIKMRRWLQEIASIPKGLETLQAIDQSGHKLIIKHSFYSIVSSGKASAPMSSALIDGRGESVDIFFNFDIPDAGSHLVFDTHRQPIEYTAVQNLYHELAHAMHMMQGTWRYAHSERQAILEENEFRRQQAKTDNAGSTLRFFVSGGPICPEFPERIDHSWQQGIICR